MATPEEIKKLLDQINKAYEKLGSKNPFKNFDTSNITDATATIEQLETALEGVKYRLELSNTSAKDLSDQLKSIVQEVKNTNTPAKDFEKSLKRSITQAQKLKYEEEDISKLSKKQLEQIKEKLEQSKSDNIQNAQRLLSEEGINENIDKRTKAYKRLTSEQKIAVNYLRDTEKVEDVLNDKISQRIKQEEKIGKALGASPAILGGIGKALNKMGLPDFGLDDALEESKEMLRNSKEEVTAKKALSTYVGKITEKLKEQFTVSNAIQFVIKQMYSALISSDKSTGELAKAFGTSYASAARMRNELNTIANLSVDVNVTTDALQKSLIAVNKEFGTATMLSGELLTDFTNLTEVAGYTNEAASRLSKISVATGTDLSKNTAKILGQAVAFNATNKLALNEKEIVEGVAKASKATTLSLGMQPDKLAKAVLQAKALGSTLEKVEQISQSLLDFEGSIASELEAELLTGRDLNLERARLYALNNDIEGVAREIAGQIGSAANFTKMNVIQQEALAKSVGMTREDLAASLIERQALSKIGAGDKTALEAYNRLKKQGVSDDEIAVKLGDDKLAQQLKSQSIQERFNASILKLQDIFVSLAEPMLQIISPFMDLLNVILPGINLAIMPIIEGIKVIGNVFSWISDTITKLTSDMGALGPILKGLIGLTVALSIASIRSAIAWIWKSAFSLGPIAGTILAVAGTAGMIAALSKTTKAGDMFSPADGKTQVSTKEGGLFELSPNDDLIAAPGLKGKMNKSTMSASSVSADMSRVEALLAQLVQKQDRPVQVSVEMDGEKVAKGVGNNSTRLGTSMSTNTYKVQ